MTNSLLTHFPESYTPNQQQLKLLTEIETAFNSGYKFVICSAPTGTGKSFISKTLANASNSPSTEFVDLVKSYSAFKQNTFNYEYETECNNQPVFGAFGLTITKALQDQYQNLFNETKVLKGKSNYTCEVDSQFAVDNAPCIHVKRIKDDCWKKNICPYYTARNDALASKFSVLNYKMFFALPEHVKNREYIICDEASELEEEFVKEFSCAVGLDFLKKCDIKPSYPYITNHSKMLKWVGEVCVSISERVQELEHLFHKVTNLTNFLEGEKQKMISLKNLHNKLVLLIDSWHDSEYIIEKQDNTIKFTPLKVDKLTPRIFKHGKKIVLMSATIIDHKCLARTLGIDKYKYIEADSTFDSKKSPIHIMVKNKLNARNLPGKLPQICNTIAKICSHHSNEKGIIHTHTNDITKYLQINLKGDRFLFREPGTSNEDIMLKHTSTDMPTVLVSPSMVHGIDLKGDLATFQIIIKAPFLPLLNTRIKTLFDNDPKWYINKMLSAFIQACGRGIRSSTDHCVTYVLDGNIADAILRNKDTIPKYFLDRVE